jgi:5-formyltetrahydrofolate cyclo-ligase
MPTNFDPDTLAQLRKQAKSALRKRLNALRSSLPVQSVAERSGRIVARLATHPLLRSAQGVGLYAAMPERGEVDLGSLHELLVQRGTRLYYPFMDRTPEGYDTGFRQYRLGDALEKRGQRFAEPSPNAPVAARGDIDLLVVPALGITLQGYRLGFGAGFYDATLPDLCPPAATICVGYDFQLLVELPVEPHDFKCDEVITDAETSES